MGLFRAIATSYSALASFRMGMSGWRPRQDLSEQLAVRAEGSNRPVVTRYDLKTVV